MKEEKSRCAVKPMAVQTRRHGRSPPLSVCVITSLVSEAAYERSGYVLNVRKEDAQKHIDQALESILRCVRL